MIVHGAASFANRVDHGQPGADPGCERVGGLEGPGCVSAVGLTPRKPIEIGRQAGTTRLPISEVGTRRVV